MIWEQIAKNIYIFISMIHSIMQTVTVDLSAGQKAAEVIKSLKAKI